MTQKQFTDYMITRLLEIFPQSRQYQIEDHKDVSYIEISSRLGKLNILISTRECELTIGFSAGPGLFYWHEHLIDQPLEKKIAIASEIINDFMHDRKGIIYSSVIGPFPGDPEDIEEVNKYREENETIEYKHWSDF